MARVALISLNYFGRTASAFVDDAAMSDVNALELMTTASPFCVGMNVVANKTRSSFERR
jgi:hypothetical protein